MSEPTDQQTPAEADTMDRKTAMNLISRARDAEAETSSERLSIAEFANVRITHDLEHRGRLFRRGTPGVVVHKHNDDAYEIEFADPSFAVITLTKADIALS